MSKNKPSVEELKNMVVRAELSADLKANPELKKQIESILIDVDSQRASVDDATNNIIQLINTQAPRL